MIVNNDNTVSLEAAQTKVTQQGKVLVRQATDLLERTDLALPITYERRQEAQWKGDIHSEVHRFTVADGLKIGYIQSNYYEGNHSDLPGRPTDVDYLSDLFLETKQGFFKLNLKNYNDRGIVITDKTERNHRKTIDNKRDDALLPLWEANIEASKYLALEILKPGETKPILRSNDPETMAMLSQAVLKKMKSMDPYFAQIHAVKVARQAEQAKLKEDETIQARVEDTMGQLELLQRMSNEFTADQT